MANQDRVNFVWAESALTTIPPIPVSEAAYRDTTQTPEQMEVGQQYDTIYNSARYNQLLFLLTSVAKTLCENGIMPFLAGQEYSQYARCIFTDGKLYTASRAILANEQPYPTPGDDSGVWTTEESDENSVPDSRRVIAGTGLTGGGPLSADVTLAAKLTDRVDLTDSTTAASATAVKTVYALADTKQARLGFTPVQQSGGTGQGTHKVYIGWAADASGLKAQVNSTELGNIVTTSAGCTKAPSAATADLATTATSLRLKGGADTSWAYAGKGGQPNFVWGSNDGVNMDVWNPSNFDVASADISGRVQLAVPAVQWVVNIGGPQITVPLGGTYRVVCICFNEAGDRGSVKYHPGAAGGTVLSYSSTDRMVAGLCARVA